MTATERALPAETRTVLALMAGIFPETINGWNIDIDDDGKILTVHSLAGDFRVLLVRLPR